MSVVAEPVALPEVVVNDEIGLLEHLYRKVAADRAADVALCGFVYVGDDPGTAYVSGDGARVCAECERIAGVPR